MKLWIKLSIVTVSVLLLGIGVSGAIVIRHSAQYNQQETVESYKQQLKSSAYALGRELERGLLPEYSDATKYSYLTFLLRKFDSSQYILLEGDEVICNLTPYDLENAKDDRWNGEEPFGIIQKSGNQYILVTGKKVPMGVEADYSVVLVKDVSTLYNDIRQQIYFFGMVYAVAVFLSVLLVFLLTRKLLAPLRELQKAAGDISEGKWGRRANVHTRDEIGEMAQSFNSMAEKIEEQVDELSKVAEKRRQMLGSLTHELKTPMTSIIGYSDSLLHVNLKEQQQERALMHIHEECKRLERLSGKLMSLMGLYDNDSISMELVDMRELFDQVTRLEKYHLNQNDLKVSCNMESKMLDKDLFESLLINLIDNAAKASPEGEPILLIGEGNVISVQDFGCGIPDEEIERVTEAFYMVDKARSRKAGGSGLGLALCSQIAEMHGAKLMIESQLRKGTKVSIMFDE